MHPILFYVGSYPIFSYGVCIILGLVVLYAVALIPARRAGWEWEQLLPIASGVLMGGVLGMRLSHLVVEPDRFVELLDFNVLRSGATGNILGLMIGGYLGGTIVQKSLGYPAMGSYYAPAMAATSVVWRVGCTLGGCCYGRETDLPWAIHLAGADRHPTMVYEGLFNLALLGVLWRLRRRITDGNDLLYLYFAVYAFFRFWLEFIRLYPPLVLGLTGIQYICLGILAWQGVRWWQRRAGVGTTRSPQGG